MHCAVAGIERPESWDPIYDDQPIYVELQLHQQYVAEGADDVPSI
jgi:hypothetical protein